jgi:hypothetical protein
MLDAITDMFCDTKQKPPAMSRQIRDRLKTHALMVPSGLGRNQFEFDHEDFREFFLGEQLGRYLSKADPTDIRRILRAEILSAWAIDTAIGIAVQRHTVPAQLLELIQEVSKTDGPISYLRENCGSLAIRIMEKCPERAVRDLTFPIDALSGRILSKSSFSRCYFRGTSLDKSRMTNTIFTECNFERIDLAGASTEISAHLSGCTFHCVVVGKTDDFYEVYDRDRIRFFLAQAGFDFPGESEPTKPQIFDQELQIIQKVVNTFRRTTTVHEGTLRLRLSVHSLGGHLKTGHAWPAENRPTELDQDKSIYNPRAVVSASIFHNPAGKGFILARPGRRVRQRRDATGAPIQEPGFREGESPFQLALRARNPGRKAIHPGSARAAPSHPTKPFSLGSRCGLGAPAARSALEHMAVVE